MNALNIYQINIYQNILFMFKHKMGVVPSRFTNNYFKTNINKFSTRATGNYIVPVKKKNYPNSL